MPQDQHKNIHAARRALWLGIVLDIIILDQISKWYVTEMILHPALNGKDGLFLLDWYLDTPPMLDSVHIKITSFFNIVMAWNTGVSFSLFSNAGAYMPPVLTGVALGIVALFSKWLWRAKKHAYGIAYALIIGGALGNVIDRIRFGAVIDFLDFHAMGYHWPAFNIADMAVVSGVALLITVSLFFDLHEKERYPEPHE